MQRYSIGNIEFDELLCVSLKKEVFLKLPLIKKYVYCDEYFEMLLKSLKLVHEKPTGRILDSISAANDLLVKDFGNRINQETEVVYYSSVLWEWFCLLAYYIHQLDNDPQWLENYLPHAKAFQIRPIAIKETQKGEILINKFIEKRKRVLETQKQLQQPDSPKDENRIAPQAVAEYNAQIEAFKAKIAELETENTALKARIAELESQSKLPHLTFIQTEGKSPNDIRWAYEDLKKAAESPAKMALCLVDLQHKDMLKGQDRFGKLKRIKDIHKELKDTYGFTWTYSALCTALRRGKKPSIK